MEPSQFSALTNQMTRWPNTQVEWDDLAKGFLGAIRAEFICVFSSQPGGGIGLQFAGKQSIQGIHPDRFVNYLQEQAKRIDRGSNPYNRFQLVPQELFVPHLGSVSEITYIKFIETKAKDPKNFGGLIVGSTSPLSSSDELGVRAIAQRLLDLGRIADLEAAIEVRSQFLSIASHELKTPLTSIYGILQLQERMLRAKGDQVLFPEQERHHNFLKMVIRQVERLNELIDGLLDVSRIQNNRFMVEPTDTDVAALLKDCVQNRLYLVAEEAGVKLQLDSVEQLLARVDPVRMEEVINNLVMNAVRFSPEGGVVWLRLRGEEGAFRLTVRDQGPSIPMQDRERIFQPFERAQRTARMGGLGLGLFISRQIALLHGGNVSLVESIAGKGNVFEAYFPVRTSQFAY